jgi:hypothetical protein
MLSEPAVLETELRRVASCWHGKMISHWRSNRLVSSEAYNHVIVITRGTNFDRWNRGTAFVVRVCGKDMCVKSMPSRLGNSDEYEYVKEER